MGLTFTGGGRLPLRVESSPDLQHWKTAAYLKGGTTWISPTPLSSVGKFFRLAVGLSGNP